MKRLYFILNIILFSMISNMYCQQGASSVSYLSSYIDRPVSLPTGVPDINVPIFELDAYSKISLNYNIENSASEDVAGEMGIGWMLMGKGVISKQVKNGIDEEYDNSGAINYVVNEFDDTYVYLLPNGVAGKFRFIRNITDNTFSLVNLTQNKLKIEYERENNNATLLVTSFTIIDDQGIKYVFNDYSQISYTTDLKNRLCKSEFFISKIIDTNNNEIVTYSYDKKTEYYEGTTAILNTTCKLKTIQPKNGGAIEFTYVNEIPTENTLNDPDYLTDISLRDPNGKLLFKYIFSYITSIFPSIDVSNPYKEWEKRVLVGIEKKDVNLQNIEKTTFSYHPSTRLLERITTPNNGIIQYSFEQSDYFIDKESQSYLNYLSIANDYIDPDVQAIPLISQIPFDTKNSNVHYLNITGDPNKAKVIYIHKEITNYYPIPVDPLDPPDCSCQAPDGSWYINCDGCPGVPEQPTLVINHQLKKNGQIIYTGGVINNNMDPRWEKYTEIYPGLYTIELSGTGGMGNISVYELKLKNPPYKKSFPFNSYRLKNVKYFDSPNNSTPVKSTSYTYSDFLDGTKSSGYIFNYLDSPSGVKFVLYKNVKVVEQGVKGYSKFYFKTPDDYPKSTINITSWDNTYWKYYLSSMSGVMDRKEIYNSDNQIVASTEYETIFEELPNADYYNIYLGQYTKFAYTKSNKITEKLYNVDTGGYLQKITENTFNLHNYAISASKHITSDGFIMETTYQYAAEKNNTKLLGASMFATPLEVTQIRDGNIIGKVETFYNHSNNIFPSSIKSTGINGVLISEEKNDIYDAKGNLLQSSSKLGVPTTYIYGYNRTLPIAKIEGARYEGVMAVLGLSSTPDAYVGADIVIKSNLDIDDASEQNLRNALEAFRKTPEFKKYLITTYTYDPLIGVKSVTSANGFIEYYSYDNQNRLVRVEDSNHNIIKENKYSPSLLQ